MFPFVDLPPFSEASNGVWVDAARDTVRFIDIAEVLYMAIGEIDW